MQYRHFAAFGSLMVIAIGCGITASRAAPGPSLTCTKLNRDLDELSKSLAMNYAEGIGDSSAVRATMRETEYSNLLTRVKLTMELMRDNHCKLPASVPSGVEYASSAISCQADKLSTGAPSPAACDRSKWVPHRGK